jgi:hypothetical protein
VEEAIMSTNSRGSSGRRLTIGIVVAAVLVALVALAVGLFLAAQSTAAPTSPQTNGMIVMLAAGLV